MEDKRVIQLNLLGEPTNRAREKSNYCKICGRPLKNPDSIAKGIGPVCEKKMRR
jgi:hypothetical protein